MRRLPQFTKMRARFGFSAPPYRASLTALCLLSFLFVSCSQLEKPQTEEFYSESKPPRKQEFRWSNGKRPKTFDPAFVSAPPETDIVRAIYDGLTETDSKSLKAVPAIAKEWSSSDDHKVWTFTLRRDSKWSNGKPVLAQDFERSWKRIAELGEKAPSHELIKNFVGVEYDRKEQSTKDSDVDVFSKHEAKKNLKENEKRDNRSKPESLSSKLKNQSSGTANTGTKPSSNVAKNPAVSPDKSGAAKIKFQKHPELAVESIDDYTLR
ncbi:MAG: hypothetical protein HKN25_00400, partial [Pyrinomonadaceae bacterium]|nr:hypothetical protein [Pyrinomonadaceae bacterium]